MKLVAVTILCSLTGPLLYVGSAYAAGRFQLGPEVDALPMLGGGFLSTWLLFRLLIACRWDLPFRLRIGLPITAFCVHYVLVFLVLPSPLELWCFGMTNYIDAHIGLGKLQEWGEEAVTRYERGELKVDGKCKYYAGDAPKLAASEVPEAIAKAWREKPEIGIHTPRESVNENHVELSWYGYELMLGRPSLAFKGQAHTLVYDRVIRPGVIFCYWDVK